LFLQEFTIQFCDVIVAVCNETGFRIQDKKWLLQLRDRLSAKRVLVVHNFRRTRKTKEFFDYFGQVRMEFPAQVDDEITRPSLGPILVHKCTGGLEHYFLAKDGSEAGLEYNPPTINQLLSIIKVYDPSQAFLRLFDEIRLCLAAFFPNIKDVGVFPTEEQFLIKARTHDGGSLRPSEPRVWCIDPLHVGISRQKPYICKYDENIDEDKKELVLVVWLPGLRKEDYEVVFKSRENQVAITGNRILRVLSDCGGVSSGTDSYQPFAKEVASQEKRYGKIEQNLPIWPRFTSCKDTCFEPGKCTMVFREETENLVVKTLARSQ